MEAIKCDKCGKCFIKVEGQNRCPNCKHIFISVDNLFGDIFEGTPFENMNPFFKKGANK
jgi:hypothetical protein